MDTDDKRFVTLSLEQAKKSVDAGGFPAGAVIVKDGKIISKAISIGYLHNDPTEHAEMAAIRDACRELNTSDLSGSVLYESVECCLMCFSAAYWAGISKIVFALRKTPSMAEKQYYEGVTKTETVNNENKRKVALVFAKEYEKASLTIIMNWEKMGGFSRK